MCLGNEFRFVEEWCPFENSAILENPHVHYQKGEDDPKIFYNAVSISSLSYLLKELSQLIV